MLSTGGNGGLPGHFTSRHDEGAATLCAEPRPMAKTFFLKKSETSPIFQMTVTHRDNFMVPAQCSPGKLTIVRLQHELQLLLRRPHDLAGPCSFNTFILRVSAQRYKDIE